MNTTCFYYNENGINRNNRNVKICNVVYYVLNELEKTNHKTWFKLNMNCIYYNGKRFK